MTHVNSIVSSGLNKKNDEENSDINWDEML